MPMAIRDPQYGGYRVFVGDLGPKVLKQDLEKAFEQFGRLLDCWVARNPPGHAFLLFKYPREAERAVERMEGSMVSGRRIRVEHARPHEVRMKEISRRGGTVSHTISGDLPPRYSVRPRETSHKGPRPRDRGGKDWHRPRSREWPPHPRKSSPSRYHSDHYDHYRRRRSWSPEHDRYKRRRSEEARDRSPRDWSPRDRSPRDRSPRDWPPRDRSPRDRSPRDWPPRDRSPRDRSARDRSPRDRSPRDRSPRYRSSKDRSPSDKNYYEDREGTGNRGSKRLMSVAAPFPKKAVMKTDQGNQTDTELLTAMSAQVQESCQRAAGGEQTTPEPTDKPAIQASSPVNGIVTTDAMCGPEDSDIGRADDKDDKLAPVSSKADDNQTIKESSNWKDVASGKSSDQAKPEMSTSSSGPEERSDHGKTDREKSKGHLELNRPRFSLHLSPTKHRRSSFPHEHSSVSSAKYSRISSTHEHSSVSSSVSSSKHRRSSFPHENSSASSTRHRRTSSTQVQTSPSSASGSRHRESSSTQVQISPSSASASGRRNWSGSDSESDMSDNEVSVSCGDVNGNEEVDVNLKMVQRGDEMVKRESGDMVMNSKKTVKKDSEELAKMESKERVNKDSEKMMQKDSEEMVKKDSEEVIQKDSEVMVKKDSDGTIPKDSEGMIQKDSEEMVKKDSEEMIKEDNKEMIKKDSDGTIQKDSEGMIQKDSEEMVKKDSDKMIQKDREGMIQKDSEIGKEDREEIVKEDTGSLKQMNTLDIPLPEMTLS